MWSHLLYHFAPQWIRLPMVLSLIHFYRSRDTNLWAPQIEVNLWRHDIRFASILWPVDTWVAPWFRGANCSTPRQQSSKVFPVSAKQPHIRPHFPAVRSTICVGGIQIWQCQYNKCWVTWSVCTPCYWVWPTSRSATFSPDIFCTVPSLHNEPPMPHAWA